MHIFGELVWGIQTSLELLPYSKLLIQILNKLKWDGPKFRREPIEKTVLWDFRENTFNFYGW